MANLTQTLKNFKPKRFSRIQNTVLMSANSHIYIYRTPIILYCKGNKTILKILHSRDKMGILDRGNSISTLRKKEGKLENKNMNMAPND